MKKTRIDHLPALSLDQPFAHLIFHHGMSVESRRWSTERRGTIAIHATAKRSKAEFEWVRDEFGIDLSPSDVDFSCVIGIANLVDVITKKDVTKKTATWFIGPFGFVLEDIVALPEPVPAKGNRKFWHLKGAPLKATLAQLTQAQIAKIRSFELRR